MSEDRKVNAPEGLDKEIPAPELPYLPKRVADASPIGLIGCGGIAPYHLDAYKRCGYDVVALCDVDLARAEAMREKCYPEARVFTDYREVLALADIGVADIATHPEARAPLIEAALRAGKHVLSQKPFVIDLDVGRRLCDLADAQGLKLAVNQNGRWAPHFSYLRHAVRAGLIGDVVSVHLNVHWDHNWTADTPFNAVKHLILYDFGIHWYDILCCFMGEEMPGSVFASTCRAAGQKADPHLLGQVLVAFANAQASIVFDGSTLFGAKDHTTIVGTEGTLHSHGPDIEHQTVTLHTKAGVATPVLEGTWFTHGFEGTMGELLSAITEDRDPFNSGRNNLKSLALCYAVVASAETGQPKKPGEIRVLPH